MLGPVVQVSPYNYQKGRPRTRNLGNQRHCKCKDNMIAWIYTTYLLYLNSKYRLSTSQCRWKTLQNIIRTRQAVTCHWYACAEFTVVRRVGVEPGAETVTVAKKSRWALSAFRNFGGTKHKEHDFVMVARTKKSHDSDYHWVVNYATVQEFCQDQPVLQLQIWETRLPLKNVMGWEHWPTPGV